MIINIILILIAIPILVLPFYDLYKKDEKIWYKKLTGKGIIFYALIIAVAALQVIKEFQNLKNERESVSRSDTLKTDIDSLKKVTFFSSDTIGDLRDSVLTPQIAGHNLKNKLGLIKFGNYDNNKKEIYT